jgi:hypothetical protein
MAVVLFPGQVQPSPEKHSETCHPVPDDLIEIISAVQVLGEPVTAGEIQKILTLRAVPIGLNELNDQLHTHCSPQFVFDQQAIFRKFPMAHQEYWAFTSEFRIMLNQVCLEPVLRTNP